MRNAPHVPYADSEIMDRDGWCCRLCGDPIDPSLKYPDRMAKSIDHIIPLSAGGHDAPYNVQAAHLGCNISKGAALPAFVA